MLGATTTESGPVTAPDGTVTVMDVSFHRLTVISASLKRTLLFPCVAPKLEPEMMTWLPTDPVELERLVITGVDEGDAVEEIETLSNTAVPVVEKRPT